MSDEVCFAAWVTYRSKRIIDWQLPNGKTIRLSVLKPPVLSWISSAGPDRSYGEIRYKYTVSIINATSKGGVGDYFKDFDSALAYVEYLIERDTTELERLACTLLK